MKTDLAVTSEYNQRLKGKMLHYAVSGILGYLKRNLSVMKE